MLGRHCSRVQIGRRPGVDADAAVNRVDADLIIGGADGHGPTRVEIPRITVGQSLVKPPVPPEGFEPPEAFVFNPDEPPPEGFVPPEGFEPPEGFVFNPDGPPPEGFGPEGIPPELLNDLPPEALAAFEQIEALPEGVLDALDDVLGEGGLGNLEAIPPEVLAGLPPIRTVVRNSDLRPIGFSYGRHLPGQACGR